MKRWIALLLVVLLGGGVGLLYYVFQKPKYKATTTFILEEKSTGGNLAGLASQFGLNIGGVGSGGSIFTGDNILEILKSKKVISSVLLRPVKVNKDSQQLLVDYFLGYTKTRAHWNKYPQLHNINFKCCSSAPLEDSILNSIYEGLIKNSLVVERVTKQGTIIKVQVTAQDPLFSRALSERLVDEASRLYLEIRTGTAIANINQLQRKSDSLLLLLNNKSYTAALNQPLDVNPGIKTAVVPVEIASRDKTVLATLYAEVTKNLEASKLLLSQQTPVIQVLDKPSELLDNNRKGKLLLVLVFGFVSGFIFILYELIIFFKKSGH